MRNFYWLIFLSYAALPSQAAVLDTIHYKYYEVTAKKDQNLQLALNNATPVKHDGQAFHGYTQWEVQWSLGLTKRKHGTCRPTSTQTTLTTTITLPKLISDDADMQLKFEHFYIALKQHELGHYQLGKEAATEIDREMMTLPAMRHCSNLKKLASETANRTLAQYREKDRAYDVATEHGKLQGAWLDN